MTKKIKAYQVLNLPPLFFILFLGIYLLFSAIKTSIFDYKTNQFIFTSNIFRLLNDSYLLASLKTTISYVSITVIATLIIGLFIAEFIHHFIKSNNIKNLITLLLILPIATAPVAIGVMGRLMFTPEYGVINVMLKSLNIINEEIKWFSEPLTALLAIVIMDVWEWTPFVTLVMLSGLFSIPKEIYEAAKLDGASTGKIFRFIDLEYLKPLLLVVTIFRIADEFRVFDIIMIMTKGGPGFSTETLAVYLYRVSFKYFDLSYGSFLAILILLVMILISFVLTKLLWKRGS
jgi:multiple sugar transport system permease protein